MTEENKTQMPEPLQVAAMLRAVSENDGSLCEEAAMVIERLNEAISVREGHIYALQDDFERLAKERDEAITLAALNHATQTSVIELEQQLAACEKELAEQKRMTTDVDESIDLPAGFKHHVKFQCDMMPLTDEEFDDYVASPYGIKNWIRMRLDKLAASQLREKQLREAIKKTFPDGITNVTDPELWEALSLHHDTFALDALMKEMKDEYADHLREYMRIISWIRDRADEGQIQIAKSLLGTGYEIAICRKGKAPEVKVYSGTFDAAIDAAMKK